MENKYKLKIVATLIFLLLCPATLSAAWVDDWLQQKTTTSPNYFSGQQRGYYSGGSFNARWPNSTSYPVTVEMPRIKSGCGGIDVFMGGFSFMNTDYSTHVPPFPTVSSTSTHEWLLLPVT